MNALELFLVLVGFHFLADYPLQGDFLSKAKNRRAPLDGVPWWQAMTAHCGIQALFVGLATGVWWLALAEFVVHFVLDDAKCRGWIGFNQDQAAHVWFKALWVALLTVKVALGVSAAAG